ncbi:MAG TPA: DNA-formamidopyrimidine glycosylase family protein [Acidimicrobiales bacterium]|nr:DNA-formamidopyrimidine glycosylase family protein [Acidimicrobiales bacterium]
MPEMLEVEYYRRMAEGCLGRPVRSVEVADPHCLRGATTPAALRRALSGRELTGARRLGKLLLLDTAGPTLGIRFGMTGGLILDQQTAVDRLLYSPPNVDAKWVRFTIRFADGGGLDLHDPRRMGRVELEPDERALGPDAFGVTPAGLRSALSSRPPSPGPPLKARLQDQAHLAGVGNLLADEVLWRAGLSPERPSGSLSDPELRRLHRHLRRTLDDLLERGGSHTGDLMAERRPGGHCPRDGTPLRRGKVGGRTTWWCPRHQH